MTFATELRKALTRRGGSIKAAARAMDVTEANVHHYRSGRQMPSMETAQRMADVLDWPSLAAIVRAHRTRPCEVCGVPFLDAGHGGPVRRFCSERCSALGYHRRVRQPQVHRQSIVDRNLLATHRDAVAAHCGSCEPEGTCRDADCALRPISPLPLVRWRAA